MSARASNTHYSTVSDVVGVLSGEGTLVLASIAPQSIQQRPTQQVQPVSSHFEEATGKTAGCILFTCVLGTFSIVCLRFSSLSLSVKFCCLPSRLPVSILSYSLSLWAFQGIFWAICSQCSMLQQGSSVACRAIALYVFLTKSGCLMFYLPHVLKQVVVEVSPFIASVFHFWPVYSPASTKSPLIERYSTCLQLSTQFTTWYFSDAYISHTVSMALCVIGSNHISCGLDGTVLHWCKSYLIWSRWHCASLVRIIYLRSKTIGTSRLQIIRFTSVCCGILHGLVFGPILSWCTHRIIKRHCFLLPLFADYTSLGSLVTQWNGRPRSPCLGVQMKLWIRCVKSTPTLRRQDWSSGEVI